MKASEVREMSIADLKDKIAVDRAKLDSMKINHAVSPLEKTHEIKQIRRDIARMCTILSEKEKEQK